MTDPYGSCHRTRAGYVAVAPRNVGLHQEWLLDEALKETFPASDPISPARPTATYSGEGQQETVSADSETPA